MRSRKSRIGENNDADAGNEQKGVFQMKFMKEAMARKQYATDRMADEFVKEMERVGKEGNPEADDESAYVEDVASGNGVVVQRTGGRVTVHPGSNLAKRRAPKAPTPSDASSVTLKTADLISTTSTSPPQSAHCPTIPVASTPEPTNPWLVPASDNISRVSKVAKKTNQVIVGKESSAAAKSKNKLRKLARKRDEEREQRKEEAVVEIDANKVLSLSCAADGTFSAGKVCGVSGSGSSAAREPEIQVDKGRIEEAVIGLPHAAVGNEDEEGAGGELEEQELALQMMKGQRQEKKGVVSFQQRELVALAFTGDSVVQQFEEIKKQEIAADARKRST